MTKRVLIIGTSHSVGDCGDTTLAKGTRWHDHIGNEYDAEVKVLAKSGATSLGQFIALSSYFYENREEYFDLCLIEGRHKEYTMDSPLSGMYYTDKNDPEYTWYEENYNYWQDKEFRKGVHERRHRENSIKISGYNIDKFQDKNKQRLYKEYLAAYFESDLMYQHSIAHAFATCSIAMRRCKTVKWICWPSHTINNLDYFDLMEGVLYPYIIKELYPVIVQDVDDVYKCECGHLNKAGNTLIWNYVKPYVKEYLEENDGK